MTPAKAREGMGYNRAVLTEGNADVGDGQERAGEAELVGGVDAHGADGLLDGDVNDGDEHGRGDRHAGYAATMLAFCCLASSETLNSTRERGRETHRPLT